LLNDTPAGNAPVWDQLKPPEPPLAVRVGEYGTPCSPAGKEEGLIPGAEVIVIANEAGSDAAELLSVAVTWNGKPPATVGVPLMVPLAEFKLRPGGRLPLVTAHVQHVAVTSLSDADNCSEYGTVASPEDSDPVVITGCAFAAAAHTSSTAAIHPKLRSVFIV
jgi:hypothetical protein